MRSKFQLPFILILFIEITLGISTAYATPFQEHTKVFEKRFHLIHPLLHGSVKNVQGFLESHSHLVKETVVGIAGAIGTCWGGTSGGILVHNLDIPGAMDPLLKSNTNYTVRYTALLDAAEKEFAEIVSADWDEQKVCPEFYSCGAMGINSKRALIGIRQFILKISEYEDRVERPFFGEEDTARIFQFFHRVLDKFLELSISKLIQSNSKKGEPLDDGELAPYLKIINYLNAIPTKFHLSTEYRKKNHAAINQLVESLDPSVQMSLYDFMNELEFSPMHKKFGHSDGDSGRYLLFSGPSGSSKTFTGKKLPKQLGFPELVLTFEELRQGQGTSYSSLEDLLSPGAELSGFEKKFLQVDKHSSGGSYLNPLAFVDEADHDRTYTLSELKDQFDQFKWIRLPALGLTIPGFLNCIFTTNNEQYLNEPALVARITQIRFRDMKPDKKIAILSDRLKTLLNDPVLKSINIDPNELAERIVNFNPKKNIRILLGIAADILNSLNINAENSDFRRPSWLTEPETVEQFLVRKLSVNSPTSEETPQEEFTHDFARDSDDDSESHSEFDKRTRTMQCIGDQNRRICSISNGGYVAVFFTGALASYLFNLYY